MNNEEKCALYLRKKDIRRFMLGARKRYESYGRITGTVTVKYATDSEKSDMSGILARMISGPDIRVSLKEFIGSVILSMWNVQHVGVCKFFTGNFFW